ncbi:MAG: hypothetical protein MJ208_01515 [Bacilli bacterium]|nr:hypothetical protein [Bacilli bacterium]
MDEELENLPVDDEEALTKKRSHRRLFWTFVLIDIGLLVYIVYSFILLFISL